MARRRCRTYWKVRLAIAKKILNPSRGPTLSNSVWGGDDGEGKAAFKAGEREEKAWIVVRRKGMESRCECKAGLAFKPLERGGKEKLHGGGS